ncbi:Nse1 non-SMC component of SMC5-6 complex-domain-containing protein, partial [Cantharellus anzutake]|uniref:Nse1 non-SMC component of SMC5-6 complex-domain-containing protein n=1 Tax=Cantharellus anzutake TaxID=1750568 RepID=UPI0019050AD3
RLFLQSVISRGWVTDSVAKALARQSVAAVKSTNASINVVFSEDYFNDMVVQTNRSLEPLGLAFRRGDSEVDGRVFWAITNDKGDEIAQMATQYSPNEVAYFRQLASCTAVEQIMTAPNETFCVSSLAALREVSSLTTRGNMTKAQAEIVLQSFVVRGWLLKSRHGRYSLSPRTILELEPYLKSTYEDEVLLCASCDRIVTKGLSCFVPECRVRLHEHCFNARKKAAKSRPLKCPSCDGGWSSQGLNKVGEEAVREGSEKSKLRRKQFTEPDVAASEV